MPIDDAKTLVRRYVEEVWNKGNLSAIENLTASSYVFYFAGRSGMDRDATCLFLEKIRAAFPDWRLKIVDIVTEGPKVVVRWEGTATQKGVFHGIQPTGILVNFTGISIYTVERGLIFQEWEQMDILGLLQQLGAMPDPV